MDFPFICKPVKGIGLLEMSFSITIQISSSSAFPWCLESPQHTFSVSQF